MRIVLDAGHGTPHTGAVGRVLGVKEQNVTLAVCFELKRVLQTNNHTVYLTRNSPGCLVPSDRTLDLNARAVMAGRLSANCLISIHCNSAADASAHGFECFTTPGQDISDGLATEMLRSYGSAFPHLSLRADMRDGDADKEADLRVIKRITPGIAGVLFELAFLSNRIEEGWLGDRRNHPMIAAALGRGIDNWGRHMRY